MPAFNFSPFPELTTERLLLRKIITKDAPAIFFLRSDERVLQYIGKEPASSIAEAEDFIKLITTLIENNESIMWAISLSDNPGNVIGTICYWRIQPENYRAEIGYVLHPGYWRQGIMKEIIQKVILFGFETMKLHSIEARISAENIASASLLEATGFVKEGHLKEDFFFRGKFSDTIIYSRINKYSFFLLNLIHREINMLFREAIKADIPQIQIIRNSVTENMLSDPALVPDTDVEDYLFRRGKGWVCEIENKIVGFAIVSVTDKNVWALFILPGFDKKGIGSRLHREMLNWYFSRTHETIWLSTSPGTRAEQFYRNAGWTETGLYGKGEIRFEMTAETWKNGTENAPN